MKKQKAPAVAGMIRKVGREIFCEDKVQELEFLIVKREGGGRAGTVRTDTCYPKDGLSHHSPGAGGFIHTHPRGKCAFAATVTTAALMEDSDG